MAVVTKWRATTTAFSKLDENERRVTLDVIDQTTYETSVPVYLSALGGSFPTQQEHARSRIRRCAAQAVSVLVKVASVVKGAT